MSKLELCIYDDLLWKVFQTSTLEEFKEQMEILHKAYPDSFVLKKFKVGTSDSHWRGKEIEMYIPDTFEDLIRGELEEWDQHSQSNEKQQMVRQFKHRGSNEKQNMVKGMKQRGRKAVLTPKGETRYVVQLGPISRLPLNLDPELYDIMSAYIGKAKKKDHFFETKNVEIDVDEEKNQITFHATSHGEECEVVVRPSFEQHFDDKVSRDMLKSLQSNSYILNAHFADSIKRIGTVTFLTGRVAVLPLHFVKWMQGRKDKIVKITLHNQTNQEGHEVDITAFTERAYNPPCSGNGNRKKDVAYVEMGTEFPLRRNITKYFLPKHQLQRIDGYRVNFSLVMRDGSYGLESYSSPAEMLSTYDYDMNNADGTQYHYAEGIKVDVETRHGDCGAMCAVNNKNVSNKICGMLTLGNDTSSIFTPLTSECNADGLSHFKPQIESAEFNQRSGLDSDLPKGCFNDIGKTTRLVPSAGRTTLVRSPVYNEVIESHRVPALLKRTEEFDPLVVGLAKCGKPNVLIDPKVVEKCRQDVAMLIRRKAKKPSVVEKRVLTLEESIKGVEGNEWIKSVNVTTSPGYPYIFERPSGSPGKRHWIPDLEQLDFEHPPLKQLQKRIEEIIENAAIGKRTETVWIDTLKDELRPKEKVALGKTRVFSAGPMDFTIVTRMYFSQFIAALHESRVDNQCAVGVNPFSSDWDRIALSLEKHPHKIAGDFTNYDGTESSQILWAICDIINDWYDDSLRNKKIRQVLFAEIAHGVHAYDDNLYEWNKSLPSGNAFTADFNTLYNLISMRIVWVLETGLSLQKFNANVSMIAYGDDNCLGLSELGNEIFNQEIISRGYLKIGMIYTDEAKQGTQKSRKLSDINFLKRKFKYDNDRGRFIAPLDLKQVLDQTNWIRKNVNTNEAAAMNLQTTLRELSLHGKDTFDEWFDKIVSAYERIPGNPILSRVSIGSSYEDYLDMWEFDGELDGSFNL